MVDLVGVEDLAKKCCGTHGKHENAISTKRVPKSEELFNVGHQPSIPTRGLSKIISDKPERKVMKFTMKELANNRFNHGVKK